MSRRECNKCGRQEPTSIFDGTCSEGGACEFLTSEERDAVRCRSTLRGERCAYERGHSGCHWGITDQGEETWTEESKALADVAAQLRTAAIAIELLATQKGSSRSDCRVEPLTKAQLDELERLARLEPTSFVRVAPWVLLELVRGHRLLLSRKEALTVIEAAEAATKHEAAGVDVAAAAAQKGSSRS